MGRQRILLMRGETFDALMPLYVLPEVQAFWPIFPPYIYQDEAMTTPATAHGDPIGAALDVSGYDRHVTQATTAAKPGLDTSVGLFGSANFDGGDWLANQTPGGLLRNVGGATIFVVGRYTAAGRTIAVARNGNNEQRNFFSHGADGTVISGGRRLDADTYEGLVSATGVWTSGVMYLTTSRTVYTNREVHTYQNLTEVITSTTFQTAGNTSDTDSDGLGLGARHDDGNGPITGHIIAAGVCGADIGEALLRKLFYEWAMPLSKGLIAP